MKCFLLLVNAVALIQVVVTLGWLRGSGGWNGEVAEGSELSCTWSFLGSRRDECRFQHGGVKPWKSRGVRLIVIASRIILDFFCILIVTALFAIAASVHFHYGEKEKKRKDTCFSCKKKWNCGWGHYAENSGYFLHGHITWCRKALCLKFSLSRKELDNE